MYRIGILGTENSHAMAFSKIFNGLDAKCELSYPDIQVVGCFGAYPEENEKLKESCGLEFIAERPEDMLGRVDAVMVTARDGRYHPEYAAPFIEAGIPAFIDKPFANDGAAALELAQTARRKGVPLVGGSSTKLVYDTLFLAHARRHDFDDGILGGHVTAPVSMDNVYGGFYFYSSHLAEISMSIFGYAPQAVRAFRSSGGVTAVARYDGFDVTNQFLDGNYLYSGAIYGRDKRVAREIDIRMCYQHECELFADMLRTGRMSHSYEELVAPVFYLNAIEKSYENDGVWVELPEIVVE